MNKQVKWVLSKEDWYPTLLGNDLSPNPNYTNPRSEPAVRVSFMQLTTKEWRVCVWGGDDFGLEIDLPKNRHVEAQRLFDKIVDFTTKQELKSWGFIHA